jgi:hypothetical protein
MMASLAAFSAYAYNFPKLGKSCQKVVEMFGKPCDKSDAEWILAESRTKPAKRNWCLAAVIPLDNKPTHSARHRFGLLHAELR